MEGVIGFTTLFAGTFAPKNWAFCQGQIINIQSNTALFSILGITYGGNGTTNFMLPNLQGRAVIGAGQGPGLSNYILGQLGGEESIAITPQQMPAHIHPVQYTTVQAVATEISTALPTDNTYGNEGSGEIIPYGTPADVGLKPFAGNITMATAGFGAPIPSNNPFMALNFIICQYGVYPSRS